LLEPAEPARQNLVENMRGGLQSRADGAR